MIMLDLSTLTVSTHMEELLVFIANVKRKKKVIVITTDLISLLLCILIMQKNHFVTCTYN